MWQYPDPKQQHTYYTHTNFYNKGINKEQQAILCRATSSLLGDHVTSSWLIMYITVVPCSFLTGATRTEHRNAVPTRNKNKSTNINIMSILLLINAHFSYTRAAHGMFCPLSYAQVTSLKPHLSVHYFNIKIRHWTCTTLMTSESGEQSVPGAT